MTRSTIPKLLAFASAQKSVAMRGRSVRGMRIANMPSETSSLSVSATHPSGKTNGDEEDKKGGELEVKGSLDNSHPHLHPMECSTAVDIFGPIKPLTTNGRETKADTSPRHLRVVRSAMTICVRSERPLRMVGQMLDGRFEARRETTHV